MGEKLQIQGRVGGSAAVVRCAVIDGNSRRVTVSFVFAVVASMVAGCSQMSSADLSDLSNCGDLVFPERTELIWGRQDSMFGDELTDGVVEIPADRIAEFKERSGLAAFEPGLPIVTSPDGTWRDSGRAELLEDIGKVEHMVNENKSPTRYVMIHDDGVFRTVFVSLGC
ncbi:hypothetical protein [Nocardia thailandica]